MDTTQEIVILILFYPSEKDKLETLFILMVSNFGILSQNMSK